MMKSVPGLLRRSVDQPFTEVLASAKAAISLAGAELMAQIDQSDAARRAGLRLRPTTLLMFGNPTGGTHLMEARPDSAIDLPMKLLIVADDGGKVHITGEDPQWIMERHGGSDGLEAVLDGMRQLMQRVLDMTTSASLTGSS